jgi:hypothetical protein
MDVQKKYVDREGMMNEFLPSPVRHGALWWRRYDPNTVVDEYDMRQVSVRQIATEDDLKRVMALFPPATTDQRFSARQSRRTHAAVT